MQWITLNQKRENTSKTPDDAATDDGRENDRRNPRYERVRREAKCKQPDPAQLNSDNGWRKAIFWFRNARNTCCLFSILDKTPVVRTPNWIGEDSSEHTDEEANKAEADFREGEAVVVLEDDGKGAKEEVEDAEEDCTEETEQQDHGLEEEELKRSQTAPRDGADK